MHNTRGIRLMNIRVTALLFLWAALLTPLGTPVWDKAPERWDLKDVYRILQDSPWSPTASKLEGKIAPGEVDSQTGLIGDSRSNPADVTAVPGVRMSHGKPQPAIPVLWWSENNSLGRGAPATATESRTARKTATGRGASGLRPRNRRQRAPPNIPRRQRRFA